MPTRSIVSQSYDEIRNALYVTYSDGTTQKYNLEEIAFDAPQITLEQTPFEWTPVDMLRTLNSIWTGGEIDWTFHPNEEQRRLFDEWNGQIRALGNPMGKARRTTDYTSCVLAEPIGEDLSADEAFKLIDEMFNEGGSSDGV